jgi:hypothetical protein
MEAANVFDPIHVQGHVFDEADFDRLISRYRFVLPSSLHGAAGQDEGGTACPPRSGCYDF